MRIGWFINGIISKGSYNCKVVVVYSFSKNIHFVLSKFCDLKSKKEISKWHRFRFALK
jgi:hypothetical protein